MKLSDKLLDTAFMGDENSMYALFRDLREQDPVSYVEHPNLSRRC